jgi:ribulose-bisphosphate carboxylase large chain
MIGRADRLRVHYSLRLARGESAPAKANGIAREQTVEIAPGIVTARRERRTIGRVARVEREGTGRARAAIDYPWRELVSDLPQLLNLLFGNVSMQRGIRVEAIDWPGELLARFPGPRHGVAGVRELLGVRDRPLLAAVLKPIGLSPAELARHAADCALAGIDLLKDDHSLSDQPAAPFRERILAVAELVRRAERRSGARTLYLPNLSGPVDRLAERLEDLREAGIEGAFVAPWIVGLDTMRSLAQSSGLVLLAHPAWSGTLFAPAHGLAPGLVFGDLLRLAGADLVNFPAAGGRFAFGPRDERAVVDRLGARLGAHRASFPMLAGGIDRAKIVRLLPRHGVDTVYLVGGSLYRGGRTLATAAALAECVRSGRPRPD